MMALPSLRSWASRPNKNMAGFLRFTSDHTRRSGKFRGTENYGRTTIKFHIAGIFLM